MMENHHNGQFPIITADCRSFSATLFSALSIAYFSPHSAPQSQLISKRAFIKITVNQICLTSQRLHHIMLYRFTVGGQSKKYTGERI